MNDFLREKKAREKVAEKRMKFTQCEDAANLALEKWEQARLDLSDAEYHLHTILKNKEPTQ
jgi:hypothetical protein